MIAFKGTNNFQCLRKKYEVGETYSYNRKLIMCKQGFHFCQKLEDVHKFYNLFNKDTIVLKIEVFGDIITNGDKSVTNKFKVLETIPKNKYHSYSENIKKNSVKIINNDFWIEYKYNKNNNEIYMKNSNGYWEKRKYDKNNNVIYTEYSNGFWEKTKYDKSNNLIYTEYSTGFWEKLKYDGNNNKIYYENYTKFWRKYEYDSNNNLIYSIDNNGNWEKYKYNKNNNIIYSEVKGKK